MTRSRGERIGAEFFDRPVVTVARDLIGCELAHGPTSGIVVETEAYHQSEPASHSFNGPTPRSKTLFGPPGTIYVYLSYGVHSLFNVVAEREGVGAAVLIRALEPTNGIDLMRERRGKLDETDLCSGPGKLTQALGIYLDDNEGHIASGPIRLIAPRKPISQVAASPRIGISRATDLNWRFTKPQSLHLSR
jgi:DNA-3-methyladenine glycosylase